MKKLFLTLSVLFAFASLVNAQFKPTSGFSAEVNFRPLSANPIQINDLRGRMFLNEKMAIRLGLSVNSLSTTTNVAGAALTDPIEVTVNKCFVFGLTPGFELHLGDFEKLSPYVGAEFGIGMKSASTTITNVGNVQSNKVVCEGIWGDLTNPAYTQVGFNLLTGVDYYIYKGLFMGAEVGFGFTSTSFKEVNVSTTVAATSVTTTQTTPGAKASNFGVNFNSAIRLGWSF